MSRRRNAHASRAVGWLRAAAVFGFGMSAGLISAHDHTLKSYIKSVGSDAKDAAPTRSSESNVTNRCQLTIHLEDARSSRPISGLVRVSFPDGKSVTVPELLNRGANLPKSHAAREWSVVVESAQMSLPRERLVIEAVSGLETELARAEIDLTDRESDELKLPIVRFHRAADAGWHNGNTHLHLRSMTREQADRYLQSISRADQLEYVFVSHLTRTNADRTYISNRYTKEDLKQLSGNGTTFDFAEEHRHNFGPGGEGYGHVMFLNPKRLIQPVSIGPGIMGKGTDWPPIRHGIDQARNDGATVVWCHNTFGYEDVPDWVAGVLDAHNIFDGGSRGSYEDTFYRFMNVGLRVPFSTGTDWFIYDFSRVYVNAGPQPTLAQWLEAFKNGKTFITNGPMLDLRVGDCAPGAIMRLDEPSDLTIVGRVFGRLDFQSIELVHNGVVVATARSKPVDDHFEGKLTVPFKITEPGWVALRIQSGEKNELGGQLFGHTSAVYFELKGKTIFQRDVAEDLVSNMREAMQSILSQALFAGELQRNDVLQIYREGIAALNERLKQ